MNFTRGQTQVLYQFLPGEIFEHDQYGFCRVTSVEIQGERINQDALFIAVSELLWQWSEKYKEGFADPRIEQNRDKYVFGSPRLVKFEPYPTLLECRKCKRVFRLRDLIRGGENNPHHCPYCHGVLGQLRYVQAHNCGRIEELFYPIKACPIHGSKYLTFDDTGRVRSSRWRCSACGQAEVGRLRMTPCNCTYSKSLPQDARYERGLKTLSLTDSALFFPQIIPFINFDQSHEINIDNECEILYLILARSWGLLHEDVPSIIHARTQSKKQSISNDMLNEIKKLDPNNPLIQKWENQIISLPKSINDVYNRMSMLIGLETYNNYKEVPRQLIEHIAVLDTLHNTSIKEICIRKNEVGDYKGVQDISQAELYAREKLGIKDMRIVDDFPIALCAVGYTRITRDPSHSIITPFEGDIEGRIPLYVVTTETEGIYIQLNPLKIIQWLAANDCFNGPILKKEDEAWAWLYKNVPGLWQSRWEHDYKDSLAVLIRTLIHTISHILLKHVEWSGFNQNSIGEYLIPGGLSFILYANRYAETKIGGLTTLFEQQLGIWLNDSVQSGRECIYDPFCIDEGGACVGCLHREYNCSEFNRELSRAVLYGGPTPSKDMGTNLCVPLIKKGFWEDCDQ